MIERVIRAMRRAKHTRCCTGAALDDVAGLPITEGERSIARAAIEAMREPTPQTTAAVCAALDWGDKALYRGVWLQGHRAFIDAALTPERSSAPQKATHGTARPSIPTANGDGGMSDDLVTLARDFALQAHRYQRYGDQPYRVHLGAVVQVLKDFGAVDPHVLAAGWLHDTIEDAGETRMSLATKFGVSVARLVYAVSGEGKNRRERNRSIYLKIAEHPAAAVVKCADRIANVEAATPRSRHWNMYANEQPSFERAIKAHVPAPMWSRLEAAFGRSIPSNALGAGGT